MTNKIDDYNNEIILQVYSTFKTTYVMGENLIFYSIILFIMILSCILFYIAGFFSKSLILMMLIIVFLITMIVEKCIRKKMYSNYSYKFYKDKIVYKDKWLNFSEREVRYENISEITLHQTFIQKFYNIGNIFIITNNKDKLNSGVCIKSVENPEEIYDKIKLIYLNNSENGLSDFLDYSSKREEQDIVFQLKIKYDILYLLVVNFLLSILLSVGFLPFLLIVFAIIFLSCFLGKVVFYWSLILLISISIIKTIFDKKHINNTKYNFYKDRVEYIDNFLTKEYKIVKYKSIKKVIQKQNFFEKLFNLGRIIISYDISKSSLMAYARSKESSYIIKHQFYITRIEDVQEKYNTIKKIISENKN